MTVSSRAQQLSASATLAISQRAAELRAAGRPVISLGAGEPDFATPAAGMAAARQALDEGYTHYTACAGIPELRAAIADKLRRDNDLEYDPGHIIVANGVKQCLYTAMLVLTDPGDEVLMPSPYWVSYPSAAQLVGAVPRSVEATEADGFKLQPEALRAAITPRTRVFVMNSPANPTGAVYSREELQALGAVLAKHDLWVLCDEIYEKLVYDGAEHHSLPAACPALRERCVVMNGVSKAYAMTGWRIGFAAGPAEVIGAMNRAQSHITSNAASISQYAAMGALQDGETEVGQMRKTFADRRRRVLDCLTALDDVRLLPPAGAFYVFPEVSAWIGGEIPDSAALCQKILEEVDVATVPGAAFGNDRCLRISYATADEQLDEALGRLARFFRR